MFSQALLLALTKKGLTREESYQLIQNRAMEIWNSEGDFKTAILSEPKICDLLTHEEIENCFELRNNLRNVEYIFKRIGLLN